MVLCDYFKKCRNKAVCKVTITCGGQSLRYWNLCLECAKKNKERFMLKDKDLQDLEKQTRGEEC